MGLCTPDTVPLLVSCRAFCMVSGDLAPQGSHVQAAATMSVFGDQSLVFLDPLFRLPKHLQRDHARIPLAWQRFRSVPVRLSVGMRHVVYGIIRSCQEHMRDCPSFQLNVHRKRMSVSKHNYVQERARVSSIDHCVRRLSPRVPRISESPMVYLVDSV